MKEKLANNIGLKLISLAAAIVIWFLVVQINDPVISESYDGIAVEMLNVKALTSDQEYSVLDDSDHVDITVKARKSVIQELKAENFKAHADMLELTQMGSTWVAPIDITLPDGVNESDVYYRPHNLKISIEESETKAVKVSVVTKGTPGGGYVVGEKIPTISSIEIKGPESVVKKVKNAVATVNVTDMTTDQTFSSIKLTMVDSDGDPVVNADKLKFEQKESGISVKIVMYKKQLVSLTGSYNGNPAQDYRVTNVVCDPDQITVAGPESALEKLGNSITISPSLLTISGDEKDVSAVIDIASEVIKSDDIKVVDPVDEDGKSQVLVIAYIEKMVEWNELVSKDSIEVTGAPEGYSYSFTDSMGNLVITLEALEAEKAKFDQSTLKASIDLSGYKRAGSYEVPVTVTVPSPYTVKDQVTVKIDLKKK
ncbi:YbbR-like domain-containing protein [Diplocloster agilis]|uniref:CdaR family protein n=1 Tax=Diplocloster agilis TaxID=2850323 RepID=UPI000823200D|nr:CdaR family protein [Suonthocola fibrivorans]MCU6732073.1 CdaR family protein [Suonthocola fibrivorans]SCI32510.1 Uncharacterized protein conserved in bacteria [uncultured Clostridium sp.]